MAFYLIKVGSQDRPATPEDIEDLRLRSAKFAKHKKQLVTHHAVSVHLIDPPAGHSIMWKVGNDERPAMLEDIEAMKNELELAEKEKRPVVTHHAVDFSYFC